MIRTHVSVRQEGDGNVKKTKIKKVIKGLTKASKTHAKQAKTLKGVINGGSKKREREKSLKVQEDDCIRTRILKIQSK